MVITPQAYRRISDAVRQLPNDRVIDQWGAWAIGGLPDKPRYDVPYYIAEIALEALTADEHRIQTKLDLPSLDEDIEGDLLNDLGYVQAIQASLRGQGVGR
jgi:hypothetical protein